MPLPSQLTALVERIDRELDRLESDGREAIKIGTDLLNRFPDNFTLIQLMAFVNKLRRILTAYP
ncbi:Specificity determinant for HsdM and HsdR (fragment) [Microcystis aeruginosa PCC 9807]|uniref:Specificity determinant for HsdM and HsdR n=1 Tax=Microcystis aeruginosa PCC 9807 TaxID=1160283 RepID=I4HF24_MICAE